MSDTNTKKPNIVLRILALLVTVALVLGSLVLVVYRDRLNLDALERWLTYREVETDESGEATLVTIDDDEEFDDVADYFDDLFSEEIDYDGE